MSVYSDMLIYLRKRSGYTQQYLADKLSISRSSYANYECGLRRPPFEVMEALADMYNVNMDLIFGRQDIEEAYTDMQRSHNNFVSKISDDLNFSTERAEYHSRVSPDVSPASDPYHSTVSSLSKLTDEQLDDMFFTLIKGRDKDYLLKLASKILEIAAEK